MKKELKQMPFEVKIDATKRTIQGYASTFGNKDFVDDIVMPGAFKKTIQERGSQVKLLWQHYDPIGKAIHMEEDSKGLYVEAYVSNTTQGNDALELAQDGVIDKFSIGYEVIKDEYDAGQKARLLKELKLHEFSMVTFPANEEAGITGVKSYEDFAALLQKTGVMDVTRLLKAGRKISSSNQALIENAIEALQSVLNIAEPLDDDDLEDDDKGTRKNAKKPLNINTLDEIEAKELAEILANFKIKS